MGKVSQCAAELEENGGCSGPEQFDEKLGQGREI